MTQFFILEWNSWYSTEISTKNNIKIIDHLSLVSQWYAVYNTFFFPNDDEATQNHASVDWSLMNDFSQKMFRRKKFSNWTKQVM